MTNRIIKRYYSNVEMPCIEICSPNITDHNRGHISRTLIGFSVKVKVVMIYIFVKIITTFFFNVPCSSKNWTSQNKRWANEP